MANIIILLVLVSIVAIISVQNAAPVVLTILFWKIDISLAVIIFLSILAGIFMAAVFALSGQVRRLFSRKQAKP
jgi:uncharacterized integral membrane protein